MYLSTCHTPERPFLLRNAYFPNPATSCIPLPLLLPLSFSHGFSVLPTPVRPLRCA